MSSQEPFQFGIRLGIFLMIESAGLSTVAVMILLGYVAYRSYKRYRARRVLRKWATGDISSSDAADSSLFINLMLAELIQAIGGLLNIKWMVDAGVTEGPLCQAQGILKQMGDVGVALTSLAIAIHTFSILVVRWNAPPLASRLAIAFIWLFITLVIGISAATHPPNYWGNTSYWCWIRNEYKVERIVLEYLWMWLAAFIMLVIYGIIALVMRGYIVFEGGVRWQRSGRGRVKVDLGAVEDDDEKESKAVANLMLFYPAVYIFCVFPVGLVRWLDFSGHYVPPAATIFASITFSLSGFLNAILYKVTRPELVDAPSPNSSEILTVPLNTIPAGKGARRTAAHNLGFLPDIRPGDLPEDDRRASESGYQWGKLPESPELGRGPTTGLGFLPDADHRGTLPNLDGPSRESSFSTARKGQQERHPRDLSYYSPESIAKYP